MLQASGVMTFCASGAGMAMILSPPRPRNLASAPGKTSNGERKCYFIHTASNSLGQCDSGGSGGFWRRFFFIQKHRLKTLLRTFLDKFCECLSFEC